MAHIAGIQQILGILNGHNYVIKPTRNYRWVPRPVPPIQGGVITNQALWDSDMEEIAVLADFVVTDEWSWQQSRGALFVTVQGKYTVDEERVDSEGRRVAITRDHENSIIFLMRATQSSATDIRMKLYSYLIYMQVGWNEPGVTLHHHRHPVVTMNFDRVPLTDR